MEFNEYDEMLRALARIAAHQETINADLRAMLANHDQLLSHQVEINADVKTTLARVETTLARVEALLARMIDHGTNGRDA